MGLMQVLPGTGADRRARPRPGLGRRRVSLYDPDTNIVLGTAYLRQLLDKYGGQPYSPSPATTPGPAPLARWQSQRPGMDPDFWIETISYKETRDYVARVLAFSVLYDWRLNGNALAPERAHARPHRRPAPSSPRRRRQLVLAPPPRQSASSALRRCIPHEDRRVLGGTGFVGRHLVARLAGDGHRVDAAQPQPRVATPARAAAARRAAARGRRLRSEVLRTRSTAPTR